MKIFKIKLYFIRQSYYIKDKIENPYGKSYNASCLVVLIANYIKVKNYIRNKSSNKDK